MYDREKVMSWLEGLAEPDWRECYSDSEVQETARQALDFIDELLKEQDAIEPSFKQEKDGIFVWCCGSCGAYMYHIYDGIDKAKEYAKYCRQCGKKVKWE